MAEERNASRPRLASLRESSSSKEGWPQEGEDGQTAIPTLLAVMVPVYLAIGVAMVVVVTFGASMSSTVRPWSGPVIVMSGGALGALWRRCTSRKDGRGKRKTDKRASPTLLAVMVPVYLAIGVAMIVVVTFGASMSSTVRPWIGPAIIISGGALGALWRRCKSSKATSTPTGSTADRSDI